MAENIGGSNLFGSGGHVWHWRSAEVARKQFGTIGVDGDGSITLRAGSAVAVIEGRDGGGAVLKVTGQANRAAADAAMDALENAIISLKQMGTENTWEDDCARTGSHLVIEDYQRMGGRLYSADGAICWQFYRCVVRELSGVTAAGGLL
ncbi:MAG: hypothetical protein ACE15C_14470 [Phycisphaerae bacterium]